MDDLTTLGPADVSRDGDGFWQRKLIGWRQRFPFFPLFFFLSVLVFTPSLEVGNPGRQRETWEEGRRRHTTTQRRERDAERERGLVSGADGCHRC